MEKEIKIPMANLKMELFPSFDVPQSEQQEYERIKNLVKQDTYLPQGYRRSQNDAKFKGLIRNTARYYTAPLTTNEL